MDEQPKIEPSGMDADEIKKRRLLYEVEDELWKLLKRRAWLVGIIGVGGIWALVSFTVRQVADRPLQELQKQLLQADVQADNAKRAAAAASTAADQVTTQLTSLQASIQSLKDQAKGVEDQFRLVSQRINADAKNAALRSEKDFSAAQQRIAALEALVKQIGEDNEVTRRATADYAKKVATLENRIEREQKRFAENSAYTVWISFIPDKKSLALDIQGRLASAGFKAPLTEISFKTVFLEASKGTTLTYLAASEAKAQEVLAVVRSILKDVQTKKLPDADPQQLRFSKDLSLLFGFGGLYADPTTIHLSLGPQ